MSTLDTVIVTELEFTTSMARAKIFNLSAHDGSSKLIFDEFWRIKLITDH